MISLFAGCFKWKMMGCFTSGTKDKQSKERLTLLDDSYGNNDTIPDLSKISDQNSGNNTLKNAKKIPLNKLFIEEIFPNDEIHQSISHILHHTNIG